MNQLQPIISILKDSESEQLQNICNELTEAWHKKQIFRTETEARFAVLNDFKFPTKASKYWQAIREQMAHLDALTGLSFELRRKKIDLLELNEKLQDASGYDRERLLIDRDEILFHIASGEQIAKDRVREIMQWSMLKKEVDDGSFDNQNVNTHQRESLFKSVLNHAQASPENLSSEEKLSIKGLLYGLGKEQVNKLEGDSDGKTFNGG